MNKFFTKNVMAKVLSILFALVMWIYVMSEINPEITTSYTNISVQLVGIEDIRQQGLVIMGEATPTVNIRVRGRRDEISKITQGDLRPVADVRGYGAGINSVPVEINTQANVALDHSPKFIRIELEEIVRQQKEVTLVVEGSPRTGYIFGKPDYKPTSVWIEGPESRVSMVNQIVTKLDADDAFQDITASLPLKALNSRGVEVIDVNIQTPYIDTFLQIDRLRTIKIEPNVEATVADGYQITGIEVFPEHIAIRGEENIVNSIVILETEILQLDNLTESIEINLPIIIPEGASPLDESEVTVNITVENVIEETYTIPTDNITFNNLTNGLKVDRESIPATFEVKVTATEGIIEVLEAKNFNLLVDLEDLEVGTHTVEPEVSLLRPFLDRISSMELVPPTFSIKIIEE
ncbi:CdaR family protein [Alkaliphilus peptidifermentans]|uniref:YbbR domain-containing protein n=1 Tax=Alkaliphilus peptidifermentans DSM 18978 TaxID=1120976 RepID=A0A1G5KQG2_9FIRM|nr:CdaR family protein [Alkaliphilus peptidifermentans]SCZ02812.1 YbbR domain-containing protein [Alkaliphilus peptidifermentans DSM 18978]